MSSIFSKRGSGTPDIEVQVADRQPKQYYLNHGDNSSAVTGGTPGTADYIPHVASPFDIGIFKDTLAPSLALHSSFAAIAYGIGRYTNRVEAKDWLWPAGQVANAWWSSVGRRLAAGMTLQNALNRISWSERLVLSGVTLWGGRLFYRIASRSVKRGKDNEKYDEQKRDEGYWNKALVTTFLPEALFQTVISLPFTAPFRHHGAASISGYNPYIQMFAVGLFSAGFALETLADIQIDAHKAQGQTGLKQDGVWSIVRHPNYLGDFLCHLSFPILLYGSDMLAPIELLGPIAEYVYMRYYSGDKEKEASQGRRYSTSDPEKMAQLENWRKEKNAFWPQLKELGNQWTWAILGFGVAGVAVEEGLRHLVY